MSMPWTFMPDGISKRVFMYLLQRYLGQFFEEKLTIDQLQLHVDRHNGTGTVENVSLDVQALNELGDQQNWPMEFVDGYIEKLTVTVPWAAILKDSSFVEVRGLKLTLQPKQRNESAASMFESMWSSMTNSMQLAQECMKQESPSSSDSKQTLEGIESFAQTIDSILSRVKVKFIDTIIQVEHVPKDSSSGVGVQIKIDLMQYFDEAGDDPPTGEQSEDTEPQKAYVVASFSSKNLFMDGVSLYTVEFPSSSRTFSRCVLEQTHLSNNQVQMGPSHFVERDHDTECSDSVNYRKIFEVGRHVILFAKLSGRQEVIIRIKQSEIISGPKVSIEMHFGAFAAFTSPRQVYVLLELANGLASPDKEDNSNVMPKDKAKEKPMTQHDYNRIEQELLLQMHPLHNQSQGMTGHGWSSAVDENDDERFLPMGHKTSSSLFDSTISNASSSMDSSIASSIASSATTCTARAQKRANNMESDPTAEISHFQIGISSVVVFLLHEDVLCISPTDLKSIMPASVLQMKNMSKKFFDDDLFMSGYGAKDINKISGLYSERSGRNFPNHLRLLAAPIQIEAKETTTQSAFSVSGKLDISRLELIENVMDSHDKLNIVKVLEFPNNRPIKDEISKPNIVLNFKHIDKSGRSNTSPRHLPASKTDVDIQLDGCVLEVDITIVDRLKCLLDPIPICVLTKQHKNVWTVPSTAAITSSPSDSKCNVKVTSPSICAKLRFPIPDLRPHSDPNRVPWYRRSIRNDYLSLQFNDATMETTMVSNENCQKYSLDCRSLDVFYYNNESAHPLHIGRSSVDDKYLTSMQDGFNWPRITLRILPAIKADVEMHNIPESEADLMSQSIYGHIIKQNRKEPGPFCAKWMLHESDTPHAKEPQDNSEEVVIPGDKEEMDNFIETTTQNSRIQLELMLPVVSVQLVNKHIYEVLYNRINSDLLLWEPSAPQLLFPTTIDNPKINSSFPDTFLMCKTGINYDSDSEDAAQSNIFYSAYEPRIKHVKDCLQLASDNSQSQLALNVHIAMGIINMNAPVRDTQSNVIPNQQGEFVLNIEDASIFSVSGYKGDDDMGFVCVQVGDAQLYHCDMRSTPCNQPPLYDIGAVLGNHLSLTIAKSDPGALEETTSRGGDRDFLSLAIKLQSNHETHQAKIIKLAMGLNKATLKHKKCAEPNSWISQLIDFFNVIDYTIPGYNPKEVLTEMHLHLWDCAVDYRPKYLPLRAVLTLGNFSMSSHITTQSYTSTLRFIAEECCLFLSEKAPPKDGKPSVVQVDLKRDYVNVIELGLFELSLKMNEERSGIYPLIDLRASNNILHIRTCADSGSALMQLITYFAGDGDCVQSESAQRSNTNSYSSPRQDCEQDLVNVDPQNISKLTETQQEQVNVLLQQAMEDEMSVEKLINTQQFMGEKIFCFPDERIQRLEVTNPQHYATHDLGDVPFRSNMSSDYDTDDEFCFIEDIGCGTKSLVDSTVEFSWDNKILSFDEEYFITECKQDMMKAPEEYPPPVAKYILREMTIYWHMYGGNDFKTSDKPQPKKAVSFSDNLPPTVGFANTPTGEVVIKQHECKSQKPKTSWLIKGGINRNQDVRMQLCLKKIRISHEVYPEVTHEASRQVMIISEFEIKDKLKCSNINKFLHYYTDYKAPRQSSSNMITVKSLFLRPDPKLKAQECCLRVTMVPLRLNIDQDAVEFLMHFFKELTTEPKHDDPPLPPNTPTLQPPVMSVSESTDELSIEIKKSQNDLLILNDGGSSEEVAGATISGEDDSTLELAPIFFRTVVFSNDVTIRIDYQSKHVDMTQGAVQGIVMGYMVLNDLKIRLRKLQYRHGILGIDKLVQYFIQEWHNDFIANQKTSLLAGLGPSQSFRKLFSGIIDFFWLPIAQYRKDGRIVRGLQRGARSLTTSSFVALLELTSRVINVILMVAEVAFNMLSSGKSAKRIRHNPPQDLREGMANAYTVVKAGFGETADNLIRVASHEREQKGYSGAVGGILRQIPPTIIQPIIIASEATNTLLDGMRSQLAPDVKQEATEKWKKGDKII